MTTADATLSGALAKGHGTAVVHVGHVLDVLRGMDAASVHMAATSPPYWNLRTYDGEAGWGPHPVPLGREGDFSLYLDRLVSVLAEVYRVLRDDGVCFVNVGDTMVDRKLALIPQRLAVDLDASGWRVRSEIVWAKGISFCESYSGSTMPESAKDRPTRSHETILMLTKRPRYFWDAEAVSEEGRIPAGTIAAKGSGRREGNRLDTPDGVEYSGRRNLRSVWAIGARGFDGEFCRACRRYYEGQQRAIVATRGRDRVCLCGRSDAWLSHHATWPADLVRPMIRAATSDGGACASCGDQFVRVLGDEGETLGFKAPCDCGADAVPSVVLDTFHGTGTTSIVALQEGRTAIGIELNKDYADLSSRRIVNDSPIFNSVVIEEG